MNLKQAALRLGVHYQTAYRWVRSGELAAIKVGQRYEISMEAVNVFAHRRILIYSAPSGAGAETENHSMGTAPSVDELRVLALETSTTPQPCYEAATMLAGTLVGDVALLRLPNDAGTELIPFSTYAADPALRSLVVAAADAAGGFPSDTPHWIAAAESGDVHVVPHMPQDQMAHLLGDRGRFIARGLKIFVVAVAPLIVDTRFVGGLVALRTTSTAPFSEEQLLLLREAAQWCSEAHARADRFRSAWASSTHVADQLAGLLLASSTRDRIAELGPSLLMADRIQALVANDGTLVGATPGFHEATMTRRSDCRLFAGCLSFASVRDVLDGSVDQTVVDVDFELGPVPDGRTIVSAVRSRGNDLVGFVVDIF